MSRPAARSRRSRSAQRSIRGDTSLPSRSLRQTCRLPPAGGSRCHGHDAKCRPLIRWPVAKFATDIQMALMSLRFASRDRTCEPLPSKTAVRPPTPRQPEKAKAAVSIRRARPPRVRTTERFPRRRIGPKRAGAAQQRIELDSFDPVVMVGAAQALYTQRLWPKAGCMSRRARAADWPPGRSGHPTGHIRRGDRRGDRARRQKRSPATTYFLSPLGANIIGAEDLTTVFGMGTGVSLPP